MKKSMFVMRRPGVLVVSGTITDIQDNVVVLENKFFYPVSGQEEKTRCFLESKFDVIQRMRLTIGTSILASTTDDFMIEMLLEGGETPTRDFHLKAYTIRFNGSFDFDQHNDQKEQHVMAGTILAVTSGQKQGYTWNRMTIGWRKNGKEEKRNIVYWNKDNIQLAGQAGNRVIVVTGERKVTGGYEYYQAYDVFEV